MMVSIRRARSVLVFIIAVGGLCDCAVDAPAPGSAPQTDDAGGPAATDAGGFAFGDGGADAPAQTTCDPNVRPVFVLTYANPAQIYSFDPETLTYKHVVDVVCPNTTGWEASTMSVDRTYHAWVVWGGTTMPFNKRLDRLDLATGACEPDVAPLPTPVAPSNFGMAFATDAKNGTSESLYFTDAGGWLFRLGTSTTLGQYYKFQQGEGTQFSGIELSGSGEGRLFNFIMNYSIQYGHPCTAQDPCVPTVHIGEVDKTNGSAISNVSVPTIPSFMLTPGGFAFAQWGGLLWAFESLNFGATKVYAYDPVTQTAVLKNSAGPKGIVGAGVSTCAPFTPPN